MSLPLPAATPRILAVLAAAVIMWAQAVGGDAASAPSPPAATKSPLSRTAVFVQRATEARGGARNTLKENKNTAEDVFLCECDPTPPEVHSGISNELLRRCAFNTFVKEGVLSEQNTRRVTT